MISWLDEKLVSRRRSDIKIAIEILNIALNGAGKTEIVYKADLNFRQARKYLNFLLEKGLITVHDNPNRRNEYRTTEKGRAFIKRYYETVKLVA
jgi:predicted transcriptional regulator